MGRGEEIVAWKGELLGRESCSEERAARKRELLAREN